MEFDWFWLLPLAIIPAFGVFAIAIIWWEKHPLDMFDIPEEGTEPPESDYSKKTNDAVEDGGYVYRGVGVDGRGKLYRLRFDFWRSEDNTVHVIVVGGTLAKMPYKTTVIYSPLPGGRVLGTSNFNGLVDLSGLSTLQIFPGATFRTLLDRHLDRLDEMVGDETLAFPSDDPMQCFRELRERELAKLVERGLARCLDDEQRIWRLTFRGAVLFYLTGTIIQPLGRFARTLGLSRH